MPTTVNFPHTKPPSMWWSAWSLKIKTMRLASCSTCHLIVIIGKCSFLCFIQQFNRYVEEFHRVHPACDGSISCDLFHCGRESRLCRQSFWEISFTVDDNCVDWFYFGSMTRVGMFMSALDHYWVLRTDYQFTTGCLAAATWSSTDSKQTDSSSLYLHTSFESASRSSMERAGVDSWFLS